LQGRIQWPDQRPRDGTCWPTPRRCASARPAPHVRPCYQLPAVRRGNWKENFPACCTCNRRCAGKRIGMRCCQAVQSGVVQGHASAYHPTRTKSGSQARALRRLRRPGISSVEILLPLAADPCVADGLLELAPALLARLTLWARPARWNLPVRLPSACTNGPILITLFDPVSQPGLIGTTGCLKWGRSPAPLSARRAVQVTHPSSNG